MSAGPLAPLARPELEALIVETHAANVALADLHVRVITRLVDGPPDERCRDDAVRMISSGLDAIGAGYVGRLRTLLAPAANGEH